MRKRSVSIYATTKEEYMECLMEETTPKKTIIIDDDEYDGMGDLKLGNNLEYCDDLDFKESYQVKVDIKTAEEEEKELYDQLENINNLYKSIKKKEIRIRGKEKKDFSIEDGLSLLCSYFKENIRNSRSYKDPNLVIHQSNKKFPRSMSNNSITEISVKEILESIVKFNKEEEENEVKSLNDGEKLGKNQEKQKIQSSDNLGRNPYSIMSTKESFKKNSILSSVSNFSNFSNHSSHSSSSWSTQLSNELFAQNLECEEEVLKIMMIGSTQIGKTLLINNFLEMRRNIYEPSSGLEIKKKIEKILNKNVRIEFYDTDANFHLKDTSKIYYKLCDAFFYVVDWSKKESLDYISQMHDNILNNSVSNSFFLINLNTQLTQNNCDEELKIFAENLNVIYVPLEDVCHFHIKHANIFNVFSYVLVKKMKKKNKSKFQKHSNDFNENSQSDKMSCLEPSMGFNQSYKLESYTNMSNNQISINVKRKFRHSTSDLITNV
jgi:hypothetical protein